MNASRVLGVGLVALCGAVPARAQDATKVGITMGYPASIGLIVPVSATIAIRPNFTISGSSQHQSGSIPEDFSAHQWNFAAGVGVLVYLHKDDRLRTYVAPEFDYTLTSLTQAGVTLSGTNVVQVTTASTTARASGFGGAAVFGARYSLADRFGLYGEVGFGFTHSTIPSSLPIAGTVNAWGTRGGVGVVFRP